MPQLVMRRYNQGAKNIRMSRGHAHIDCSDEIQLPPRLWQTLGSDHRRDRIEQTSRYCHSRRVADYTHLLELALIPESEEPEEPPVRAMRQAIAGDVEARRIA